jgi:hypothetical protein
VLARLKELGAQRDKLIGELDRSLSIQALWPEAFAHGKCTSQWIGSPQGRDVHGIHYALRLRVTDGDGTAREFAQDAVPAVLWPCAERGRLPC